MSNEVIKSLGQSRFPISPELEKALNVEHATWRLYTDVYFPSAQTPEGIMLALKYIRDNDLNPMSHDVHVVPIWNSLLGKNVETIWPGISSFRKIATRTKEYLGLRWDYGEDVVEHFQGTSGSGKYERSHDFELEFPLWVECTVLRVVGDRIAEFPKRLWFKEFVKCHAKSKIPNAMWAEKPRFMLEKVAESQALRMGFSEVGDQPSFEEMQGADQNSETDKLVVRDSEIPNPDSEVRDAEFEEIPNPDGEIKSTQQTKKTTGKGGKKSTAKGGKQTAKSGKEVKDDTGKKDDTAEGESEQLQLQPENENAESDQSGVGDKSTETEGNVKPEDTCNNLINLFNACDNVDDLQILWDQSKEEFDSLPEALQVKVKDEYDTREKALS